jgi:hypothetical protein
MAIYGVGSKWDEGEKKGEFFRKNIFTLGWNYENAADMYQLIASLKVGDILYLKSNQPGSRTINVKGIGIITDNFIERSLTKESGAKEIKDYAGLSISVKWVYRGDEFAIKIPDNAGRLTASRAATAYEEYLPYVQERILSKIFKSINAKQPKVEK